MIKATTTPIVRSIPEIIQTLSYISYATQRDNGMSHEGTVRIKLGNDDFKRAYELNNLTKIHI